MSEDAIIPTHAYSKKTDAGVDLYANHDATLFPMFPATIKTGIAIELPPGYFGLICPRSGPSKFGVTLANSVGVIDPGYRGELLVNLIFISPPFTEYKINKGARIAQLICIKFEEIEWTEQELLGQTLRGEKGFGSSGS